MIFRPLVELGGPSVDFLGSNTGSFAALCREEFGCPGVGVAPTGVGVEPLVSTAYLGWLELFSTNSQSSPKCASIGFAHEL